MSGPINISSDDNEEITSDKKEEGQDEQVNDNKNNTNNTIDISDVPKRTLRPFYIHQWLDIKDTQDIFLEAQVINADDHKIYIHYKGWSSSFDEYLYISPGHPHSERIALLNSKSSIPITPRTPTLFFIGLHIDILDVVNTWITGKVIDMDNIHYMVKVSYDRWGSKYDEWINIESYRIAPVYTFCLKPRPINSLVVNNNQIQYNNSTTNTNNRQRVVVNDDSERRFRTELKEQKGLIITDQGGDGNCLFRSISHQLYGTSEHHHIIREKCINYIISQEEYFKNFIDEDFHSYTNRVSMLGQWCGDVELQAMAEIYDRPIDIYAYNVTPMHQYNRKSKSYPIRLSYHFRSHYNSVIDPTDHSNNILTSEPGAVEDEAQFNAHKISLQRVHEGKQEENNEMELALALSRQEYKKRDISVFDESVQLSLNDFENIMENRLAAAKTESLRDIADDDILNVAKQVSEADYINEQIISSTLDNELERVLALSVKDNNNDNNNNNNDDDDDLELKRAIELSIYNNNNNNNNNQNNNQNNDNNNNQNNQNNNQNDELPIEVKQCIELGFNLEESVYAYSIFSQDDVSKDILIMNMTNYLLTQ